MPCNKIVPFITRTKNEWFFVAVCETCGLCVTSMSDGGAAIKALYDAHKKEKA